MKLIRGPFFQQHDGIYFGLVIVFFNNNSKFKLKRSDNRNSNVVIYDFKTSKFQNIWWGVKIIILEMCLVWKHAYFPDILLF